MKRYSFIFLLFLILVCPGAKLHAAPTPTEATPMLSGLSGADKSTGSLATARNRTEFSSEHDKWKFDPVAALASLFNGNTPEYDIPVVVNSEVEAFIKHFQGSGRGYFEKWLARSGTYLPMIKRNLRERGLPEDLAYLALIESGFSPRARSRAGATGLWQFMLWTGRYNGLTTDWWVDERKDPVKSTKAAARHLKKLYERFDDWYLAAAAYNAGAGGLNRAIKRHNSTDFWELASHRRPLKKETRKYVPKFLAAMIIAKEPEKYGFGHVRPAPPLEYDEVALSEATDINVIAKAAGVSVKEIKSLNPELLRWFTPPDQTDYKIKIPTDSAPAFNEYMAALPSGERLKFHRHRVKRGESLYSIAGKYKTKIALIAYLNDIKRKRVIREGSLLMVPVRGSGKVRTAAKKKRAPVPTGGLYIVERGDTLWDISMRFGLSVERVMEWNDLKSSDLLRPGQKLYLKEA